MRKTITGGLRILTVCFVLILCAACSREEKTPETANRQNGIAAESEKPENTYAEDRNTDAKPENTTDPDTKPEENTGSVCDKQADNKLDFEAAVQESFQKPESPISPGNAVPPENSGEANEIPGEEGIWTKYY